MFDTASFATGDGKSGACSEESLVELTVPLLRHAGKFTRRPVFSSHNLLAAHVLNSSHALPLSKPVTGPVTSSPFEVFLLEDGQGIGKTCSAVDDADKKNGAGRVADEEFMSQLQGAYFSISSTPYLIAVILRPGQATSELDALVQDTKISYLAGSITLAQMCSRVHALCKVQRECISSLCKPGRRGLSVAEASCCYASVYLSFLSNFSRMCVIVTYVQVCRDMLAKSIKRLFCFFYHLDVRLP
jgi:hypothetical protein